MTNKASAGPWEPKLFHGPAGFAETSRWHVPPRLPMRIAEIDIYRDGGTGFMILKDASERRYPFCFDKFLGRLCTGEHPAKDSAAYVTTGSRLEADVLSLMAATVKQLTDHPRPHEHLQLSLLRQFYETAVIHSGWSAPEAAADTPRSTKRLP